MLLDKALRPEFATAVIRVDPDDPVFGRGRCAVKVCGRAAWSRLLCAAHYGRWHHAGKPAMASFVATTGAIRARPGLVDAFDLRALGPQARAEVAYVLQCRHDDRPIRLPPTVVRHLIGLLSTRRRPRCSITRLSTGSTSCGPRAIAIPVAASASSATPTAA